MTLLVVGMVRGWGWKMYNLVLLKKRGSFFVYIPIQNASVFSSAHWRGD